ncbi:hypothetical protein BG006_011322 [Podila minutissima]|uniref:protein-tyrosine-phosphatase n=1 Tax=Podila minutissima TaxID=64525 RepID=A0A9P5VHN2_9FUNG|nr:hypothetical protein BG006_011322 [Podila minutissima]
MDPRPIPPRPEQNTQQDTDASNRSSPPTSGRKANGANGQAIGGLTLSITPPRFASLATLDTSKADHSQQQHPQNSQNNGAGFQNGQLHYTPLTFHNLNNGSLASPSSPSYSTIAVARARAAAAEAAQAQAQGLQSNSLTHGQEQAIAGDQGAPGGGIRSVHEGATDPFSSSSYSSAASSPGSATTPAISSSSSLSVLDNAQDTTITTSNTKSTRHQMLPASLSSSSSSLLSSSIQSPPNSTSSTGLNHLQENANAEREISEILPNFLYLGGELIEEVQLVELEALGVRRVLNMAENCDDELVIARWGHQAYLKVGLRDHVDQDLKEGLASAIKFIASSDTPIFVHCQAGKSRSVATVIGYLIQEHHWPLKKAYDHVVERRRCMSPNIGFVSQLIMLEERILGRDRAGGLVSVGSAEDETAGSRTTVVPWMVS